MGCIAIAADCTLRSHTTNYRTYVLKIYSNPNITPCGKTAKFLKLQKLREIVVNERPSKLNKF